MNKEKAFFIRVEENLLIEYKSISKKMGYNMSQRIRNYMKKEIDDYKSLVK